MGQASVLGSPGLYKRRKLESENVGHRVSPSWLKNLPPSIPHCLEFSDLWNWEPLSMPPNISPSSPAYQHAQQSEWEESGLFWPFWFWRLSCANQERHLPFCLSLRDRPLYVGLVGQSHLRQWCGHAGSHDDSGLSPSCWLTSESCSYLKCTGDRWTWR